MDTLTVGPKSVARFFSLSLSMHIAQTNVKPTDTHVVQIMLEILINNFP